MAESRYGEGTSGTRRSRGTNAARRAVAQEKLTVPSGGAPCGACKYLRRKCNDGCIFAPHFGTDQGSAKFAAVHKVFGASNVSKLLSSIPPNYRNDAASTITYEAQARLSDPVYGCVSTLLSLQQKVTTLQAELTMLQSQLVNTRFSAYATAIAQQHQHQQQQQPNCNVAVQPTYSNNSSASTTNLMNMSNFNHGFDFQMDPLQHSRFSQYEDDD